jgi:hypothetical protein
MATGIKQAGEPKEQQTRPPQKLENIIKKLVSNNLELLDKDLKV